MDKDKKYIARVIKIYRYRKLFSLVFFAIFIVMLVNIYKVPNIQNLIEKNGIPIESILIEGELVTKTEINIIKKQSIYHQVLSMAYGRNLGIYISVGIFSLLFALYCLFGMRRERLIVECYEKQEA